MRVAGSVWSVPIAAWASPSGVITSTRLPCLRKAEGTVRRVSDPDDRRQNIVEMTKKGKARFQRLKAGLVEAEDRALAPLTPADGRELIRLLRILHDYHVVRAPSAESRD
jgi:hypothetical protein